MRYNIRTLHSSFSNMRLITESSGFGAGPILSYASSLMDSDLHLNSTLFATETRTGHSLFHLASEVLYSYLSTASTASSLAAHLLLYLRFTVLGKES